MSGQRGEALVPLAKLHHTGWPLRAWEGLLSAGTPWCGQASLWSLPCCWAHPLLQPVTMGPDKCPSPSLDFTGSWSGHMVANLLLEPGCFFLLHTFASESASFFENRFYSRLRRSKSSSACCFLSKTNSNTFSLKTWFSFLMSTSVDRWYHTRWTAWGKRKQWLAFGFDLELVFPLWGFLSVTSVHSHTYIRVYVDCGIGWLKVSAGKFSFGNFPTLERRSQWEKLLDINECCIVL